MITTYEDCRQQKGAIENSQELDFVTLKEVHDNSFDTDVLLVRFLEKRQTMGTSQGLVDLAKSGNSLKKLLLEDKVAGFERLMVQYGNLFHQVAWSVLYNYHIAQDAVSESYIKIYIWLEKTETSVLMKMDVLPYFCKIVYHTALTLSERENMQKLRVQKQKKILLDNQRCTETRDEVLVRKEEHDILREELSQLPQKYHQALRLRYFLDEEILGGLDDIKSESYAQIEKHTGIKAATLRSLVKRGCQRLKERLVARAS